MKCDSISFEIESRHKLEKAHQKDLARLFLLVYLSN